MENRYEIIIFWSDEDGAFVADVPELSGCMAHGSSHAEALANAEQAVALWIETARDLGRPIPEPKVTTEGQPRSGDIVLAPSR